MFIVSQNDIIVKNKFLTYCGERWKGFKTQHTHDIKHPRDEDDPEYKPPYLMYSFIDHDV